MSGVRMGWGRHCPVGRRILRQVFLLLCFLAIFSGADRVQASISVHEICETPASFVRLLLPRRKTVFIADDSIKTQKAVWIEGRRLSFPRFVNNRSRIDISNLKSFAISQQRLLRGHCRGFIYGWSRQFEWLIGERPLGINLSDKGGSATSYGRSDDKGTKSFARFGAYENPRSFGIDNGLRVKEGSIGDFGNNLDISFHPPFVFSKSFPLSVSNPNQSQCERREKYVTYYLYGLGPVALLGIIGIKLSFRDRTRRIGDRLAGAGWLYLVLGVVFAVGLLLWS